MSYVIKFLTPPKMIVKTEEKEKEKRNLDLLKELRRLYLECSDMTVVFNNCVLGSAIHH